MVLLVPYEVLLGVRPVCLPSCSFCIPLSASLLWLVVSLLKWESKNTGLKAVIVNWGGA